MAGLDKKKNRIASAVVSGVMLLLALLCLLGYRHVGGMLDSQAAAERWADEGGYGQVSAFLAEHKGITPDNMDAIASRVDQALEEEGISLDDGENEDASLWAYSYSAESVLQVTSRYSNVASAEARAVGVGGNFFLFNPVRLVSGAYFSGDDLNKDMVLLDENLAWTLFGATEVAGMEVYVGDRIFIVAGVFSPESDFASKRAYGETPGMYLNYAALDQLEEELKITSLQLVMPNPISGYALGVLDEALQGIEVEESHYELVDNATRYSFFSLVDVIRDYGQRSMRHVGLSLPYWENAARMAEDYAALLLLLTLLLLIFPAICLVRLIVLLWRNKRWSMATIREGLEGRMEERRERRLWEKEMEAPDEKAPVEKPKKEKKRKKRGGGEATPPPELPPDADSPADGELDVSELVRTVLEGDESGEKTD